VVTANTNHGALTRGFRPGKLENGKITVYWLESGGGFRLVFRKRELTESNHL
jgi:hypothetical protein